MMSTAKYGRTEKNTNKKIRIQESNCWNRTMC